MARNMTSHETGAGLQGALTRMYARKWRFLGVFVLVALFNFVVLAQADLLPDAPDAQAAAAQPSVTLATSTAPTAKPVAAVESPVKVSIPALGVTRTISNPTTTNIAALDKLLLSGAVHYPTSAKLGEVGNVVLFGHSSYLPVVINQAYKTFDGIQTLHQGDTIIVYSKDKAYTYKVVTVQKASTTTDGIPLAVSGKVLTLATCNDFTGKTTDRFIVTADFVESHSIATQ